MSSLGENDVPSILAYTINDPSNHHMNDPIRWGLCHSAEEHRGPARGDGSHVLRRDGASAGVLAQLWHRSPRPEA